MDIGDFEVSTKIFSSENFILQHNSMQYFEIYENFIHKTARFAILQKFQLLKILRSYNIRTYP